MKAAIVAVLLVSLAMGLLFFRSRSNHDFARLQAERAAWATEKSILEADLERAQATVPEAAILPAPQLVYITNRLAPAEIIERLKNLRVTAGSPRESRLVIYLFETLAEMGPAALPAIRQCLAQNFEVEYDSSGRRPRDGKIATEFNLPPSLRLGLLETTKRIGGGEAEALLSEVLTTTTRGAEVAYTTYALQELVPGKYRDAALAAARGLLTQPASAGSAALDKYDRDFLFGVLMFFGDGSYATTAQTQMIQPNGTLDAVAVRYLQKTLGEQSIPLVARAWQDQRVPAEQKEPLARVALAYAGLNPEADQIYQAAINDSHLTPSQRQNLIEDLNETGFADPQKLTASDLPLIQKRISLIEKLAPNPLDNANAAGFQEAYKDLVNMYDSLQPKPATTGK